MNLFELFVKIGVDDQASSKLKDIGGKLGDGLKTAAKIGTAAVGAAAAGITALTTAAVNNYAEYDQLVGGVETLFKDSADTVMKYAENAYMTAGLSANEYMSTVTSFSASLLQSLGGDTEAAAEYANQALTDMSDNANKMGTDMSLIQNAYQGFAKANYTMLDNLKLGYGGTQSEMQRLIADAAELSDTVDAQDMSFANIVKAINVVQMEMGITGTTAKEAGATIAGSVGAMKSAWSNLITGLADDNADIGKLVDNLVTTIVGDGTESNLGVLGNVMPAVKTALNGASKLVSELLPEIVQEIPVIINDNLPILAKAAISIIQSLADGISDNQEMLMETALETITYLAESLITMLPQIVALGLDLIVSLANGIAESLPELIPTIVDVILQIVDTLTDPQQLENFLDAALTIILELAYGLMDAIPQLTDAVFTIVDALVQFLLDPENIVKLLDASLQIILAIATGLINSVPRLVESAIVLIDELINVFLETNWPEVGRDVMQRLSDGLRSMVSSFSSIGSQVVDSIKNGISSAWSGLTSWFNNLWDSLFDREIDFDVDDSGSSFKDRVQGSISGSHKTGLDYVPYDDYLALLHKGERVLTAEENRSYSQGANGIQIVQNINVVPQTPVEFASATLSYFEQARWAF